MSRFVGLDFALIDAKTNGALVISCDLHKLDNSIALVALRVLRPLKQILVVAVDIAILDDFLLLK